VQRSHPSTQRQQMLAVWQGAEIGDCHVKGAWVAVREMEGLLKF